MSHSTNATYKLNPKLSILNSKFQNLPSTFYSLPSNINSHILKPQISKLNPKSSIPKIYPLPSTFYPLNPQSLKLSAIIHQKGYR